MHRGATPAPPAGAGEGYEEKNWGQAFGKILSSKRTLRSAPFPSACPPDRLSLARHQNRHAPDEHWVLGDNGPFRLERRVIQIQARFC